MADGASELFIGSLHQDRQHRCCYIPFEARIESARDKMDVTWCLVLEDVEGVRRGKAALSRMPATSSVRR
jgi:hypothetical protein